MSEPETTTRPLLVPDQPTTGAGTPEERASGIGGSDAAAAIGLSPWRTAYELYLLKIGELEPTETTEPMRFGALLEPIIREEYVRRTGRAVYTTNQLRRHPKHEWMIGHLDGEVSGEGRRILEIKSSRLGRGFGEAGTDQIPLNYLLQCHHYMILAGAEVCDVAILIGGSDFRLYHVEADTDIAAALIEQEASFWAHVVARQPPPPMSLSDIVRRWGQLAVAGSTMAGEAELTAIEQLHQIRRQRDALDAAEEAAKSTLLTTLGDTSDTLISAATGEMLASWKLNAGRKAYSVPAKAPFRQFYLRPRPDDDSEQPPARERLESDAPSEGERHAN